VNRDTLAAMLGLSPPQVDLIENDVGGGFGARGEFYPEDFLIPFAARHVGRPVRWLEDRREHLTSMNHARQADCEVESRRLLYRGRRSRSKGDGAARPRGGWHGVGLCRLGCGRAGPRNGDGADRGGHAAIEMDAEVLASLRSIGSGAGASVVETSQPSGPMIPA
jgi:hypothetical protein